MLTPEQRAAIAEYAAQGIAKAEIARRVDVSRASVHRVLNAKVAPGAPAPIRRIPGKGHARAQMAELFELFEGLRDVTARCLDEARTVHTLERIGWFTLLDRKDVPRVEEWGRLYLRIKRHYETIERQVTALRVDLPTLQPLYRDMLEVRTTWAAYRAADSSDPDDLDEADRRAMMASRQDELARVDKVVSSVKKLIIMSQ